MDEQQKCPLLYCCNGTKPIGHLQYRRSAPHPQGDEVCQCPERELNGSCPWHPNSQGDEDLRARLDQLWGWAKAGKNGEYYLMSIENVDDFTKDVMALFEVELHKREAAAERKARIEELETLNAYTAGRGYTIPDDLLRDCIDERLTQLQQPKQEQAQ